MKKVPKLILSLAIIGLCLMISSCKEEVDKPNDGGNPNSVGYFNELLDINVYNENATELLCELHTELPMNKESTPRCELSIDKTYILDIFSQKDRELETEYMTYEFDSEFVFINQCDNYSKAGHACFNITCVEPVENLEIEFRYSTDQLPEDIRSMTSYIFTFVSESEEIND